MTMGDKIVVMNGGRVRAGRAPLELYDRPANTFVATFLGSPAMNLLPGRVESEDSPRLVLVDGLAATIAMRDALSRGVTSSSEFALSTSESIRFGDCLASSPW